MTYLTSILKRLRTRADSDLVDKINYYYTPFLLVVFGILISAKQYVGYPIQCWVPAHFTDSMEQYTENYCWVQNTWWLPLADYVPKSYNRREESQLTYYQWVPFILILEALMFYAPSFIWQTLSWYSEVDLQNIIRLSSEVKSIMDRDNKNQIISTVAYHIDDVFKMQLDEEQIYSSKRSCWYHCFPSCKTSGFYLVFVYLLVKVIYLVNIIGQFFMLTFFLGAKNTMFGIELFVDLLKGRQWHNSGIFPRVTLCDFEVKVLGNVHRHTVQCVLMINMFNEKIFLFLWFWFVFLLIATVISLLYWSACLTLPEYHRSFARQKLKVVVNGKLDSSTANHFASKYLRPDIFFIIKMISNHAGEIVVSEIFHKLYKNYLRRHKLPSMVLVHSNSSGNVSLSRNPIFASNGKILFDNESKENISFKENFYQPYEMKYSKKLHLRNNIRMPDDDLENGAKLDRSGTISAKNIHYIKKRRAWVGAKTPSLTDKRKQDKLVMKVGEETADTGEDEESD